ncbi:hypothetical protein [Chryseobacterium scophthalmum]|uniref:hypothetical protein n=1 Tax=Chryseobacterium scophthalmum TaxID=59733 RepID=UPI003D02A9CA
MGTILSYTAKKINSKIETGLFYVNPDGSMGEAVLGPIDCDHSSPRICCQEYDLATGQPTNNVSLIVRGNRP